MSIYRTDALKRRLADRRSGRVILLSHCLLNENTRYLGGACRPGVIREIIERCIERDLGIVQMPCPEERAWGGVSKKLMLMAYGSKGTAAYRFLAPLVPLFVVYTKMVYRMAAKETVYRIRDYKNSGLSVAGIVGIDGSPSCGVTKTLDLARSFDMVAGIDLPSVTMEEMNFLIRSCVISGEGFFINALRGELAAKGLTTPFFSHDLIAELDGKFSVHDF